jgi:hypothetical protein
MIWSWWNLALIAAMAVFILVIEITMRRAQKAREWQEADPVGHAIEELERERRTK